MHVTIQRVLLSADRSLSEVRQASRDTLQVHPWKLSAPIPGRRRSRLAHLTSSSTGMLNSYECIIISARRAGMQKSTDEISATSLSTGCRAPCGHGANHLISLLITPFELGKTSEISLKSHQETQLNMHIVGVRRAPGCLGHDIAPSNCGIEQLLRKPRN